MVRPRRDGRYRYLRAVCAEYWRPPVRLVRETWGPGTLKMAAWSEEAGLPKPEILEIRGAVVVRPRGKTLGKPSGKRPPQS
jgi:hypothetical protein